MCKSEIYIRNNVKENYNNLLKYSKTKSCIVLKYPEFWINLVLPQFKEKPSKKFNQH